MTSRIRRSSFRPSSTAAMWWSRSAPAVPRPWSRAACARRSRRCCRRGSVTSPDSSAVSANQSMRRIPEMPLRRRFWERVVDGPIGALVLAGRKDDAEAALKKIDDPSAFAGARESGKARATSRWSAPARAIRTSSPSRRCARCRTPTSCSTTNWCRPRFSTASAASLARCGRPPCRQARHRPGRHQQVDGRCRADPASARCG